MRIKYYPIDGHASTFVWVRVCVRACDRGWNVSGCGSQGGGGGDSEEQQRTYDMEAVAIATMSIMNLSVLSPGEAIFAMKNVEWILCSLQRG